MFEILAAGVVLAGPELAQVVDWGIKILLAVGGLGGLAAFLTVRAQKRKIIAESGKTDAEANSITADAAMKKTDREGRILDMSERVLESMQERLNDAEGKIDRLTEYVEILVQQLRDNGVAVPPMPKRMTDEAHAGQAVRGE